MSAIMNGAIDLFYEGIFQIMETTSDVLGPEIGLGVGIGSYFAIPSLAISAAEGGALYAAKKCNGQQTAIKVARWAFLAVAAAAAGACIVGTGLAGTFVAAGFVSFLLPSSTVLFDIVACGAGLATAATSGYFHWKAFAWSLTS